MNRFVRFTVASGLVCVLGSAAYAETVTTATESAKPAPAKRPDPSFQAGPVKITPGGFLEFTGIYRKRNETADIGSSFAGIPFPNNPNYYTSEFRQTARNSRLSLLAQGPSDDANRLEAYIETDFVSAGTTSNANESNSYTLRIRQGYLHWQRADLGLSVTAGQAWSLATLYKKGLEPRHEDTPVVDDGQYYVGYNWTRQPQLRVVKTLGDALALGVSLEGPENVIRGPVPAGALGNNPGGAALNSTASYSTDIAPDVVFKLAYDPGFGHYELYSLTRFLHARAPEQPGDLSSERNNTTVAQSIGAGAIVPIWPKRLDLHATTLIGRGNGRYGSAQLGDSTFNSGDGSLSALRETQVLVGLVGHVTPRFDAYLYGGFDHQKGAYGLIPNDNSACETNYANLASLPAGSGCGGVGTVRQIAGGFLWKLYSGPLGFVHAGPEVEYVTDTTFTAKNGTSGHTDDTIVYLTARYFPFQ